MKRIVSVLFVMMLIFTGCSQDADTQKAGLDNELIKTDGVQKILTAADIQTDSEYQFAISKDLIEGIDTYKALDKVTITSNDGKIYSLKYTPFTDDGNLYTDVNVDGELTQDVLEGYYTLNSVGNGDKSIDVTISVK